MYINERRRNGVSSMSKISAGFIYRRDFGINNERNSPSKIIIEILHHQHRRIEGASAHQWHCGPAGSHIRRKSAAINRRLAGWKSSSSIEIISIFIISRNGYMKLHLRRYIEKWKSSAKIGNHDKCYIEISASTSHHHVAIMKWK